jgi:ParB family chromosome partitioning protein
MPAKNVEIFTQSGTEIFIPLNKLKKSPCNARKTPHSEASIEAYAASIAAKGILQNLVVEPELDGDGAATGFYFVTIGEGRRLAQLLRVKRKEIKKAEPIRCVIDTAKKTSRARICIPPTSSRRSRNWPRNAVSARRKSPPASA